MADDITIPLAAIGGSGGLLSLIGGYLLRSHNERIKRIEEDNESNAKTAAGLAIDLANYKLDSEKRFAKDDSVQSSLSRLHARLDDTATKGDVKELRDDIKTLIAKTGA